MSSVEVSETVYVVSVGPSDTALTVSEQVSTVEVRGGVVGPAPAGITTDSALAKEEYDVLMWSTTRARYEPARISAPSLTVSFLADLVYEDGSLNFSLADGSQMLPVIGV